MGCTETCHTFLLFYTDSCSEIHDYVILSSLIIRTVPLQVPFPSWRVSTSFASCQHLWCFLSFFFFIIITIIIHYYDTIVLCLSLISMRLCTFKQPYRGWTECQTWCVAMAGQFTQPFLRWPFLWRIPHQQPVGLNRGTLFQQVRSHSLFWLL